MAKGMLFGVIGIASAGFVTMVILMAIMMFGMMGSSHMSMMGGQGSDPAKESPVEGATQVRLEDFAFSPANIVVDIGTTITWTNYDNAGHTVTSDDGDVLRSGLFGQNEIYRYTFTEAGEYRYYCEPHPNMQGLVTVRPLEAG